MPKKNRYSYLRGQIKTKFGTEFQYAKALGISQQSLSSKLNGKNAFSQKEMKRSMVILELDEVAFCKCFFSE